MEHIKNMTHQNDTKHQKDLTYTPHLKNFSVKDEVQQYWGMRASGFDQDFGHGIHSKMEMNAWQKMFSDAVGNDALDVLDLGCGTGEMSKMISLLGHKVTGVDFTEEMLALARKKNIECNMNVSILLGDAEDPPVSTGSFDVIYNRHLVWTLPNPESAFKRWYDILRPNGCILIVDGVWQKKDFYTIVTNKLSQFIKKIMDKNGVKPRNSMTQYKGILQQLNHPNGISKLEMKQLLLEVGFKDIIFFNVEEIIKAQKKSAPLWFKVQNRKAGRYIIKATK